MIRLKDLELTIILLICNLEPNQKPLSPSYDHLQLANVSFQLEIKTFFRLVILPLKGAFGQADLILSLNGRCHHRSRVSWSETAGKSQHKLIKNGICQLSIYVGVPFHGNQLKAWWLTALPNSQASAPTVYHSSDEHDSSELYWELTFSHYLATAKVFFWIRLAFIWQTIRSDFCICIILTESTTLKTSFFSSPAASPPPALRSHRPENKKNYQNLLWFYIFHLRTALLLGLLPGHVLLLPVLRVKPRVRTIRLRFPNFPESHIFHIWYLVRCQNESTSCLSVVEVEKMFLEEE